MRPTDDERREVARRLRKNAEEHPKMQLILNVAFACDSLRPEGAMDWNVTSHDAAMKLADLIEPAPDRTCRAEVRRRDDEDMSWACLVCSACGEKLHYREIVTEYGEESCEMLPYCAGCGARVEGAGE